MNTLRDPLRMNPKHDDELSAVELLARAPLDQIDEAIRGLKGRRSADEIRSALVERIARAPLSDFQILKTIYMSHCVGWRREDSP
jgi:hypothetical protein